MTETVDARVAAALQDVLGTDLVNAAFEKTNANDRELEARIAAINLSSLGGVPLSSANQPNGYAKLDANALLPTSVLPPLGLIGVSPVSSQAAMLALVAQPGDVAVRTDQGRSYMLRAAPASTLANWQELLSPTDAVTSVNSRVGAVQVAEVPGSGATGDVLTRLAAGGYGWQAPVGSLQKHAITHYWNGADPIDPMEIGALTATAPSINLMPDSGRFAGAALNPLQRGLGGVAFAGSPFFASINSSALASGGQFIHDNNNFGGTSGIMTQDVVDLMSAMGRSGAGARFGVEFYVKTITAGSGTVEPHAEDGGINRYPVTQSNNKAMFGMGNYVSQAFWMRVKSVAAAGRTAIIPPKEFLAINGVALPTNSYKVLSPSDGWVHVALFNYSSIGYNTTFPAISANAGDVVQIAVPITVPGRVRLPVHTAPVPTINGSSA